MNFYDDVSPNSNLEAEDYYMDLRGFRVFKANYHIKRGYCCGNGCKHCPYFPKHQKGNRNLRE